jgi:hypothetical protein
MIIGKDKKRVRAMEKTLKWSKELTKEFEHDLMEMKDILNNEAFDKFHNHEIMQKICSDLGLCYGYLDHLERNSF